MSEKIAPTTAEDLLKRVEAPPCVSAVLEQIETNLRDAEAMPSPRELIRLIEIEREMASDPKRQIKVGWVEEWETADSEE